ncbi:S8 family serine peptidase [Dyella halodurans]|uniref:Protease pro-enzyme activation domain-containing protein n=1 Tax=Dyella halodurans TaxID=1920171 RepID=A0ABV9C1H0_9GAMM|nr:protease pro-enzyme activation domain-containing protein [Dyella halodurans]
MKSGHLYLCGAIALALAGIPVVSAAQSNAALVGLNTAEAPRVTRTVDNRAVSALQHTHLAVVDRSTPIQGVDDATPMSHLHLVLQRSAQRQAALEALSAAQHDPKSSKFHQWVTPEQFGQAFGVADADIAATTAWLRSQGFTVNSVYPNKREIDFSGNAGQVRRAFHTSMNRYTIDGATHVANASDISVPSALLGVVAGVAGLNDIHPQPQHVPKMVGQFDASTRTFKQNNTAAAGDSPMASAIPSGARGLVPYDMSKMYGTDQLLAAGITGKGINIAVVENAGMQPSDWYNFANQFGLFRYGGTFQEFQPQAAGFTTCEDPGNGSDAGETVLDAEWATGLAPGANVWVATCTDTPAWPGEFVAATNLINGANRPNIISMSYGVSELRVDPGSKVLIDALWAQADAEGISVFISSGDSGSNPDFNGGTIMGEGVGANALGTSPHDTVVGGTDTADILDGSTASFFSSNYNSVYGSALSYVPEIPWNMSCGNEVAAKSLGYANAIAMCKAYEQPGFQGEYPVGISEASSGGPSSVDAKPAWQKLVYNTANDQSRDVPDVVLFGGSYGGYTWAIICTTNEPCSPNFVAPTASVGGTSLSAPMFAGIQALIDQGLAAAGLPANQGNAAPTLYALAAQEYGSADGKKPPQGLEVCNADSDPKEARGCVFHNITRGGIATQCWQQPPFTVTPDCYIYASTPGWQYPWEFGLTSTDSTTYNATTEAYAARPGWSFAAGLGSVNAQNLLWAWQAYLK